MGLRLQSTGFILGTLLALHVVLALAYAIVTPYETPGIVSPNIRARQMGPDIGAPDELQHVNYIQELVSGRGLPVLNLNDPNLGEHYESHQPPLFYFLEAGVAKLAGLQDLRLRVAGITLRCVNVLIGAGTVLGTFFLAWWGFGRRDLALCSAAFAALLPMNLAMSGAISNDPLLCCLCTWSVAITALCLRQGWSAKRAVVLGALLGFALLTKTTAIGLIPPIVVGAFFSGGKRPTAKQTTIAALIAIALVAPVWVRNFHYYGDPLALNAFNRAFVNSPTREKLGLGWPDYVVNWVGWWTARSFVGVFGYMNIFLSDGFYRVAIAVLLVIALGGFLALGQPEWKRYRPVHILNGTFLVVVILMFAAFNVRYFQGQARYLFPAIGPISIGFGLGILYFARDRWKSSFVSWICMLCAVNVFIVSEFLIPEFQKRAL